METFPTIVERGAGIPEPERLNYLSEFALDQLKDVETVILIGAREPAGFFAYPNVPSRLVPDAAEIIDLVPPGGDVGAALRSAGRGLAAPTVRLERGEPPLAPTGDLTSQSLRRGGRRHVARRGHHL